MDAPELSVYGEAKGEYTRQLCVFLVPSLETYFLELLEDARKESPSPQKLLWHFQGILQSIPDWNQDKVIRETEKIQKDCQCDYLDELLTAVFIAHAKVLSAIRMNTKNKDFHITIPRIDHFLHRVLSESARSLWTNAYLFADTSPVEKQKNLRQVSALLQDSILQAIRGLLPVKNILRQYLKKEDDDEEETNAPLKQESSEQESEVVKEIIPEVAPEVIAQVTPEVAPEVAPEVVPEVPEEVAPQVSEIPTIVVQTKPSVSFTQDHVYFSSDNLDGNEIQETPFAEAELRALEDEEDEEEEQEEGIIITDEELPIETDELSF